MQAPLPSGFPPLSLYGGGPPPYSPSPAHGGGPPPAPLAAGEAEAAEADAAALAVAEADAAALAVAEDEAARGADSRGVPVLITTRTAVPRSTSVLAAGCCSITLPAATSSLGASSREPSLSPACSMDFCVSPRASPTTAGTSTFCAPPPPGVSCFEAFPPKAHVRTLRRTIPTTKATNGTTRTHCLPRLAGGL